VRSVNGDAARPMLVQIFAKAAVPGAVKTRLIASLGVQGATELHRRLVCRALETVAHAQVGAVELWTTPPGAVAFLCTGEQPPGIAVRMQADGDLGERMRVAIADGLERAPGVVLVGADVPGMRCDDLHQASDALARGHDAVLGPAEDGGYWLIGLSRHAAGLAGSTTELSHHLGALFHGVPWSTPGVLHATRERLRALAWRWQELPTRWDVDRPEDLQRLTAEPALAALVADLMRPA